MPDIVLSAFNISSHLILTTVFYSPHFIVEEVRLRKAESVVQGHIVRHRARIQIPV